MKHETHCFVVMPFGRDENEQIWFAGWYREVIKPAIASAGYEPILAATVEAPSAITNEILDHLVNDPMVVVDLGGVHSDDEPNPNVMYELGIRHAFGLPHVLLAWKGQRLPFDIGPQRVMIEDRRSFYFSETRQRLANFISAAGEGHYHRPLESVQRIARLEATADTQHDQTLRDIAGELADLKARVADMASGSFRQVRAPAAEYQKDIALTEALLSARTNGVLPASAIASVARLVVSGDKEHGIEVMREHGMSPDEARHVLTQVNVKRFQSDLMRVDRGES